MFTNHNRFSMLKLAISLITRKSKRKSCHDSFGQCRLAKRTWHNPIIIKRHKWHILYLWISIRKFLNSLNWTTISNIWESKSHTRGVEKFWSSIVKTRVYAATHHIQSLVIPPKWGMAYMTDCIEESLQGWNSIEQDTTSLKRVMSHPSNEFIISTKRV